jgi:hypothetical protein
MGHHPQHDIGETPGPDGFAGLFYQKVWPFIKCDFMQTLNSLWSLDYIY